MFKPEATNPYYDRRYPEVLLQDFMYPNVVYWLNPRIKNFLIDYMCIKKGAEDFGISGLSDYSYLITPAFKALEGTLLKIGGELGFDLAKYKFRVGVVFSDENLDKFYNDVLDKIDNLTAEKKVDIKQWLNNARRILKSLRHAPAHYEGEVKDNWTKAFLSGDLIISTINDMCKTLLDNDLFPSLVEEREEKAKKKRELLRKKRQLENPRIIGIVKKTSE